MTEKTVEGSGLRKRAVKIHAKTEKEELKDVEYQKMILERLRNSLDEQTKNILQKMGNQIDLLKNHVIHQVENIDVSNERHIDAFRNKSKPQILRNGTKGSLFQEKNFQPRESLLIELFRVPHIKTIYHIFIAFLINLVLNTSLHDYVKDGKVTVGFRIVYWNFRQLPIAFIVWLGMQTVTLFVYYFFVVWGSVRAKLHSSISRRAWDWTFILLQLLYHIIMLTIPTFLIMKSEFSVALSFALLMEQVRFVMKTHSFVRNSASQVLSQKSQQKGGHQGEALPRFSKYVYFMFVPTLIYRNEYPRTPSIRWRMVFFHFAEVLAIICFLAFLYDNYMLPQIEDYGKRSIGLEELILIFFGLNIPSILYFLLGFFLLLHSWMNAFAEMLRFGDRTFYQDWWNSGSFPEYYKKWNVIVHDWLYTYIYRDITEHVVRSKVFSTWAVFIVSALFHEFILAFTFRFCYPVLFVVFGVCSTCLYFVPKKFFRSAGNFIIWFMLIVGVGCCASMYFIEYFARINCPPVVTHHLVNPNPAFSNLYFPAVPRHLTTKNTQRCRKVTPATPENDPV